MLCSYLNQKLPKRKYLTPQWTGHDGLQQVEMWKQVPPEVNGHIRIHLHRKCVQ